MKNKNGEEKELAGEPQCRLDADYFAANVSQLHSCSCLSDLLRSSRSTGRVRGQGHQLTIGAVRTSSAVVDGGEARGFRRVSVLTARGAVLWTYDGVLRTGGC